MASSVRSARVLWRHRCCRAAFFRSPSPAGLGSCNGSFCCHEFRTCVWRLVAVIGEAAMAGSVSRCAFFHYNNLLFFYPDLRSDEITR